jgi:hypothetical protein
LLLDEANQESKPGRLLGAGAFNGSCKLGTSKEVGKDWKGDWFGFRVARNGTFLVGGHIWDENEMNSGWRKFENSKGRRPGLSMIAHYTEMKLMIASLWKYSRLF